jgi:dTDP-4-amino-4,6-dideoxygalactose transaminase
MSIPLFKVFMSENVIEPLNKVLLSGNITQGKMVDEFESKLADFFDNKKILTLNSATAGLTLALRLLKNSCDDYAWPGFDESKDIVLSPALTCFATNAAILANNCNLKWLDVDINTVNINLDDLRNKLSYNTKIIYLVHWAGTPVNLNEIDKIKEEHFNKYGYRPMIIEDCAHAFGAKFNGKMLGNHNNICVFSLQAIKHLTTGDGGLIILPNDILYKRAKLLRWYGIDRDQRNFSGKDFRLENDIAEFGYKFHMNDINATIGLYNLPHMNALLFKNRYNAKYYYDNLINVDNVELLQCDNIDESSWWLFSLKVKRKEDFIIKMKNDGIIVSQVHNRNDINSCVKQFYEKLCCLDVLEKELICIPCGWWLTEANLNYIVAKIKEGW